MKINEKNWTHLTTGNVELDYITICEEASKNDDVFNESVKGLYPQ